MFGDLDEGLGRLGVSIEDNVFDPVFEVTRYVFVNGKLTSINNAHRESGADRVIEEDGVDGLAHRIVAAEREGNIGQAARDRSVR